MGAAHLDRLNSVDAGFLYQEDRGDAHMHIGGLALLDGPPPTEDELLGHVASRLHLVPRYRQKLAFPPLGAGRPVWVDDADFHLEYHVRRTALPAPGDEEQLLWLVGRVYSQRLDRDRPLWELWLVENVAGGRFALVSKNHHALLDGVGGMDIVTALFDLTPEVRQVPPDGWRPSQRPSGLRLLAHGAGGAVRAARDVTAGAAGAVSRPAETVAEAARRVQGLGEIARDWVARAPVLPLNVAPGSHRRYAIVREDFADIKAVKDAFGGTVNDVVLAVVSGALGAFLSGRGVSTAGLTVRALVPLSVRSGGNQGDMGNAITAMVARLPVGIEDPVERLAAVRASMARLKTSQQALGGRTLTQLESWLPPAVLAQASRVAFSPRMFNLLVTNVPGPQFEVYLLGRRLSEIFPVAFLAPTHTLAVAVFSYAGRIGVGLLADYDAVPDLDLLAKEVDLALQELVTAAAAAGSTEPVQE